MTHSGGRSEAARERRELQGQLRRLGFTHTATAFLAAAGRPPQRLVSADSSASPAVGAPPASSWSADCSATRTECARAQLSADSSASQAGPGKEAKREAASTPADGVKKRKVFIDLDDL